MLKLIRVSDLTDMILVLGLVFDLWSSVFVFSLADFGPWTLDILNNVRECFLHPSEIERAGNENE